MFVLNALEVESIVCTSYIITALLILFGKVNRQEQDTGRPWIPGKNSRVCSKHFVDGEPTALNPNPTLLLGEVFIVLYANLFIAVVFISGFEVLLVIFCYFCHCLLHVRNNCLVFFKVSGLLLAPAPRFEAELTVFWAVHITNKMWEPGVLSRMHKQKGVAPLKFDGKPTHPTPQRRLKPRASVPIEGMKRDSPGPIYLKVLAKPMWSWYLFIFSVSLYSACGYFYFVYLPSCSIMSFAAFVTSLKVQLIVNFIKLVLGFTYNCALFDECLGVLFPSVTELVLFKERCGLLCRIQSCIEAKTT
jgi:hypothetical protein